MAFQALIFNDRFFVAYGHYMSAQQRAAIRDFVTDGRSPPPPYHGGKLASK